MLLKQNGYYTGFFGKLGVEYNHADTLFDQADFYDRNMAFKDKRSYFYKTIGADTVHLTRYTGHQAIDFIKNAPKNQPFCLSLSFSAPHAHDPAPEQYFWQKESDSLYVNQRIPEPLLGDKAYFDALPKEVRAGFNRLRWEWRFDTPDKFQRSVKGYYRMISEIDTEIGKIRLALKERGCDKNTVVIFMGDNGYYLGERQLAGKWLMHDNSLRVPLLIYDPRVNKHFDVNDMALNIDVTKTILTLAEIDPPASYQGIDLRPYINDGTNKTPREGALFEHLWNFAPIPSSEGLRTNKWKYFRYRFIEAPEELYNLISDPLETINLAGNPGYRDVLDSLRSECDNAIAKYTTAKTAK